MSQKAFFKMRMLSDRTPADHWCIYCSALESLAGSLEHDGGEILTVANMDTSGRFRPICLLLWTGQICFPDVAVDSAAARRSSAVLPKKRSSSFPPQTCLSVKPQARPAPWPWTTFTAKLSGLQVAVETASLILDLSCVIEDTNWYNVILQKEKLVLSLYVLSERPVLHSEIDDS